MTSRKQSIPIMTIRSDQICSIIYSNVFLYILYINYTLNANMMFFFVFVLVTADTTKHGRERFLWKRFCSSHCKTDRESTFHIAWVCASKQNNQWFRLGRNEVLWNQKIKQNKTIVNIDRPIQVDRQIVGRDTI